jgi:hypothetical protein
MLDTSLFTKYTAPVKSRDTERGNLMKEFMDNLNVTRKGKFSPLSMSRMGLILEGIPTDALYVLKSKCTQEATRTPKKYFETYSKVFWFEIRPKKV